LTGIERSLVLLSHHRAFCHQRLAPWEPCRAGPSRKSRFHRQVPERRWSLPKCSGASSPVIFPKRPP